MTTTKGFIRSYSAAIHRMEKANQQKLKEAEKKLKYENKLEEILHAHHTALEHEAHVSSIVSLHKTESETMDWMEISLQLPPVKPEYSDANERKAQDSINLFKPGFIDKIFGYQKKTYKLKEALNIAKVRDTYNLKELMDTFQKDMETWEKLQKMSSGIQANDPVAHKEAFEFLNPLQEVEHIGKSMQVNFNSGYTEIDLNVHPQDIVPKEIISQTSTGKLSKRNMPETKYRKMYQEHICSAVFRCGREVLALLPVRFVLVNAHCKLLDTGTGKMDDQTILSVALTRDKMDIINFNLIDPIDAMKNFQPHMKLMSSGAGFAPVEKIDPSAIRTLKVS
ncbi:MAG TPA: hypothetical protein VNX68_10145 [Nitrosopumilaceae archaeon]|jgi:hypothetical protein|nr:hypothetical protein [Nitrosopumilaceae archaeon]